MKHLRKILSYLIFLILLALAINYFINNLSLFKSLTIVSPWLFIFLIVLFLINYVSLGFLNIYLLSPLNVCLRVFESFQLSIVGGFYNLITPFRGGMAARAVYLKKKHNFTYTNFLATLAASYVLIFLVAGIIGLLTTYLIYKTTGAFSLPIFLIFLAAFLGMLFIIVVSPKFPLVRYEFINKFIRVINGWHLIKRNKKVIFATTILSFIQLLISALMLYLQFRVFGITVSYPAVLFIAALNSIGILIAITPAGLGVTEAITVFSAAAIGITPVQSLSAALLGRAVSLAVLFILGPIFSYILLKKKK